MRSIRLSNILSAVLSIWDYLIDRKDSLRLSSYILYWMERRKFYKYVEVHGIMSSIYNEGTNESNEPLPLERRSYLSFMFLESTSSLREIGLIRVLLYSVHVAVVRLSMSMSDLLFHFVTGYEMWGRVLGSVGVSVAECQSCEHLVLHLHHDLPHLPHLPPLQVMLHNKWYISHL